MRFAAAVEVRGVEGIADPEGRTIERALPAFAFSGVRGIRVGKVIRFHLEAAVEARARASVEEMCRRLLASPVIERRIGVDLGPLGADHRATRSLRFAIITGSHTKLQ